MGCGRFLMTNAVNECNEERQCDSHICVLPAIHRYRLIIFTRHQIAFKRSNFLLIYLRKKKVHLLFCCSGFTLITFKWRFFWRSAQRNNNNNNNSHKTEHITLNAERILLSINSYLTKIKLKSHGHKIIDYTIQREE